MRGRIMPWVFTIAAVLLLSLGIMRLSRPGPDAMLSPAEGNNKARPENNKAAQWERDESDLGMVLLDISTRQAALAFHVPAPGVYVLSVARLSPADLAGIQPGDHIAALNGAQVLSAEELTTALGRMKDGDTAELVIRRGQERLTLTLKIEAATERL